MINDHLSVDLDALPDTVLCDLLNLVLKHRPDSQRSSRQQKSTATLGASDMSPSRAKTNLPTAEHTEATAPSVKNHQGPFNKSDAQKARQSPSNENVLAPIVEEPVLNASQKSRPGGSKVPSTETCPPPYLTAGKNPIGARPKEQSKKKNGTKSKKTDPPKRPSGKMPEPHSYGRKVTTSAIPPLPPGVCAATQTEYNTLNKQMQDIHTQ